MIENPGKIQKKTSPNGNFLNFYIVPPENKSRVNQKIFEC